MLSTAKIALILFGLSIFVIAIEIVGIFLGWNFVRTPVFKDLLASLPFLVLIFHSRIMLGSKRATLFICLAGCVGFIAEFIGLKYGIPFGKYIYNVHNMTLFTVPIAVIVYWSVFIYLGYSVTNSFLYWLRIPKPSVSFRNLKMLFLLVIIDGCVVTFIDLFLDPIAVKQTTWMWVDKGPYFGIPISNFIGWFMVTVLATGIFRSFEYMNPQKLQEQFPLLYIVPVLGYGVIWLLYTIVALRLEMPYIALVGALLMLPIVLSNVFLSRKALLRY